MKRRQTAELEQWRERGFISDAEIDAILLKVLDSRKGYLLNRLRAILERRNPEEAEMIRN